MWDDYRKRVDTEFTLSRELFNEINAIYNDYRDDSEIDLDLEKYDCYCEEVEEPGELCLSKKWLKFVSKTSDKELMIPLSDIEEVRRKKIVIKDSIHVKTKIG